MPTITGNLYSQSARGVRSGDADAQVGGPAAAYDLNYLAPLLDQPLDFASIHGYDNYAGQIANVRGALKTRPDVPIWLTEYASFTDLPANGPQSRHAGAMRFFRDAKGLLALTDVTKVYWAQWLDAGDAPGMGFVTFDGHRKAIYNALKIYNEMPVDRVFVGSTDAPGLDAMASADAQRASFVMWNASDQTQSATVNLSGLPFANGALQTFRIDANHASYVDNAASEALLPLENRPFRGARDLVWRGDVPAHGVVYLQASDAATPPVAASPARTKIGDWVRNYHWFADRAAGSYADFDAPNATAPNATAPNATAPNATAPNATARLGTGAGNDAQIGVVLDDAASQIEVRAAQWNVRGASALSELRLDFRARDGSYSRSVSVCRARHDASRYPTLPWGTRRAPDRFIAHDFANGRAFALELARWAPPDWDGKRVIFSFVLRDAGRDARAKWILAAR